MLVSGTLGDCAAAVALGDASDPALQQRWRRPLPRVALGQALQPYATAMIDISDGLLADLSHLLGEGLGADLEVDRLPTSDALLAAVPERDARQRLQQTGGSDYELLLSVPPDQVAAAQAAADALQTPLTVIGEVATEPGIRPPCDASGWDHFRE